MSELKTDTDWQCHGWDDHISGQLEQGRSLTFRQKLEWLETMGDLVGRLHTNSAWQARHAAVMGPEQSSSGWMISEAPTPIPAAQPTPPAPENGLGVILSAPKRAILLDPAVHQGVDGATPKDGP